MQRLGKRLCVGERFETKTKLMTKNRHGSSKLNKELTAPLNTFEVLRAGDKKFFTKGKRRYFCEVVRLIETRTGVYVSSIETTNLRYWQFTYLVKVLEN